MSEDLSHQKFLKEFYGAMNNAATDNDVHNTCDAYRMIALSGSEKTKQSAQILPLITKGNLKFCREALQDPSAQNIKALHKFLGSTERAIGSIIGVLNKGANKDHLPSKVQASVHQH